MANPDGKPGSADWIVTGEETRGQNGSLFLRFLGARSALPLAHLEAWAVSPDAMVKFLRGLVQTVEAKYGRIITAPGSRN